MAIVTQTKARQVSNDPTGGARMTFYRSAPTSVPPNDVRVVLSGVDTTGAFYEYDHALSELGFTAPQVTTQVNALGAILNAILALEGYV
jgi:hypothetical protein